jgi:glucosamine-6-phosphate deaminase
MGLGTILDARRIVLIVSGSSKAEILREALEGPVTSDVPASHLRSAGARLEVIADIDAASKLSRT